MRSIQTGALLALMLFGCVPVENIPEQNDRRADPDLIQIARQSGFALLPLSRSEESFLARFIPTQNNSLRSVVLIHDGDRVAAAFSLRSANAGKDMERITSHLFNLLSSDVAGLVDDTIQKEGLAPIDILALTDPSISGERLVFARIRDSLYEFHVAEGAEGLVQELLKELARE